ncbi:MAG TPA: MBL fold metallo-hydrolase [Vicinamibacterales bacterium]|nr:MBL fold metallo-hydrolase [Vicinamibacterales bacterium]
MEFPALRLAAVVVVLCVGVLNAAPWGPAQELASSTSASELEILRIRPNFYMIAGAGANIAVQVGVDGVVLVDTGPRNRVDDVMAAVRKITAAPIRFIVNTSADADHVGGNDTFLQAGQASFDTIANLFPRNYFLSGAVAILAHEAVLRRMTAPTGQVSPFPAAAWPTETFEAGRRYVYLNDEGIEVVHHPAAHTDGDATVFFRRSDVIVAGDLFDMTRFPTIDLVRGGSLKGTLQALNRLIATAIPSLPDVSREVGTSVIPGHGQVGDQFDLLDYRDMIVIVRDHVQDLIDKGMTLEQIKAANPTHGFRRRYGSDTGEWTTEMFVEAVYRNLVEGEK